MKSLSFDSKPVMKGHKHMLKHKVKCTFALNFEFIIQQANTASLPSAFIIRSCTMEHGIEKKKVHFFNRIF